MKNYKERKQEECSFIHAHIFYKLLEIINLTKKNKEMEPLQARILLIDITNGQSIGYFYFREAFEKVKTKYCPEDKSHFIDIGNIIEYEGKKFKVIKINFKMEPELYKAQYSGTGELSVFDTADRNCQIGVFVEKA